MTETQMAEIRQYLLSKKLPIDILIEVNDHFISQINDLQKEENLDFEKAFEKVTENWHEDLEARYPWYVLNKTEYVQTSKFEQRLRKEAEFAIFKTSILISLFIFGVYLLLLFILNFDNFKTIVKPSAILPIVLSIFVYFYNLFYNGFAFKEKYKNYKFSLYEWRSIFTVNLINWIALYLKPMQSIFQNILAHHFSLETIFKSFLFLSIIFLGIYTLVNQLKLTSTLKKIRPFFENYLK